MENQYNLTTKQTIGVCTLLALSFIIIGLFGHYVEMPVLQAGLI